jgi:chemotaxis protein MotB
LPETGNCTQQRALATAARAQDEESSAYRHFEGKVGNESSPPIRRQQSDVLQGDGRTRPGFDPVMQQRYDSLRSELERQGKNVDQLLASKGALASSLEQARARLEELRRAQAAAEARANLFRDLALRLRKIIDSGDLEIALRSGRMVLVLPNDILFDPGKAKVGARGKEALSQIAVVLATLEDRRYQVAGHTDNDPIRYSGFDSNWELATARALQVVKVLTEGGLKPTALSAAGYGEFDPVAINDSTEHKAKNRRIEIVLQPNIDELVAVPQAR